MTAQSEGSARSAGRLHALGSCLAAAVIAIPLCLPLMGCSSLFNKDEEYVPESPADALYNQGLYLLNTKQDYKEAAKKFDAVDRENPYSEWARKALLMSAYAYYQAEMYDDCMNSAKRYVTLHPGSPDAAYAQYLIGSSYYDQIVDVSRDQQRAEKAIDALQDVGRFYLNKRDFIGAINRFKVVVTQYQTTRHVEEALMRLTECYIALGIIDEAQTAAAVLGHNFPDSAWYKDAYRLVKTAGGEPTAENKGSWISRAFQKMGLSSSSQSG